MLNKKDYIVPIQGTRKLDRLEENARSSEIKLNKDEITKIDKFLDNSDISEIFKNVKM